MAVQNPLAEATERRISARHPCSPTVFAGEGAARVYNLSNGGVALFLDHEVETESPIGIELFNSVECLWHLKGARIVHAILQPDRAWLVGIVFLHELTDTELESLLKS